MAPAAGVDTWSANLGLGLGLALAVLLLLLAGCMERAPATGEARINDPSIERNAAAPPRLTFDTSPRHAAEIERMRAIAPDRMRAVMSLVGLREGGPPILVVVADEEHPLALGVPIPIAGYAIAERDFVVLMPARVPGYPYDSLDELVMHELTHVLAARAAGGHRLPRWWSEGLALLASRGWSLEDRSRVLLGAMVGVTDTATLESSFEGGARQTEAAYAISGALVHRLVQRHGPGLVAKLLQRIAAGDDFDAAFAAAAGVPLAQDVDGFWRRYVFWYRWLPFLTSGAALWASVTALAILAGVRRRRRDAEIRRRWDEEERRAGLATDGGETIH